jgi:hypothetical protein
MKIKILFFIDALGALLTTGLLFAISDWFSAQVGFPAKSIKSLSFIAFTFFVYSIICYFFLKRKLHHYLRIICVANFIYCCLTITFIILHYKQLSNLVITYFLMEILVISLLIFVEITAINYHKQIKSL